MDLNFFASEYAAPSVQSFLTFLAALIVYLLFSRALKRVGSKGYLDPHLVTISCKIVKWFLIVVIVLLSLGYFGVSVGTLWAALSGVLALIALGFVAVWSVLSNTLCSILLIIFPPFRIGDTIEIQEPSNDFHVRGKVTSINMLMTVLECEDDSAPEGKCFLRVPNNIFFQKYIRCIPGKNTQSLQKYISNHQQDSRLRT